MKLLKLVTRVVFAIGLASCGGGQLSSGSAGTMGTGQGGAGSTAGTGWTGGTGGTAGSGWTGGIGGTAGGWVGGSGGSSCSGGGFLALSGGPGCQPAIPACGAALCGNGQRDACAISGACAPRTDTEGCDGDDLGGVTCTSLGYGSGSVTCNERCTLTVSGCDACLPLGNQLLSCARPPFDERATMFALANSGSEIGLARYYTGGSSLPSLSFDRLSPRLELISTSVIVPAIQFNCLDQWNRIAVAPLASGWAVAVGGDPDVFVYVLDDAGQPVARTVVEPYDGYSFQNVAATPLLVPRPDGGPLMLWHRVGRPPRAALLAADGRSATAPIDLPVTGLARSSPFGAAYLEGTFHVVVPQTKPGGPNPLPGLTIVHLGPDGRIGSTVEILTGEDIAIAGIGAGPTDIRLFYTTGGPLRPAIPTDDTMFRRISSAGDLLTPAVRLGQVRELGLSSPVLALGDDEVFLYKPDGANRVGWARLGPDGAFRSQGFIASLPYEIYNHALVQNGTEMVAGWLSITAALRIARLAP
jgi:hypothetical protein